MLTCISNCDKMYTAEAKVGKDDGVSNGETNSGPIESYFKFVVFFLCINHASALIIILIFGI